MQRALYANLTIKMHTAWPLGRLATAHYHGQYHRPLGRQRLGRKGWHALQAKLQELLGCR